jgi:3-isopropylmalate/(R)-2-methylmalate dehydratase small subunit
VDAFTTFSAVAMPIDITNCDTDQIIPARFLRYAKDRDGFDRFLFHDLRFDDDGAEKPGFIYNQAPYREAKIIVADLNWGCGSSRENAVHALAANGIRAVIAPSFGDIHFNNCMKNGVLPVRLSVVDCERLRRQLHDDPGARIGLDLEAQTVTGPDGASYGFEIAPFDKYRMLNGLDDIAVTLEYETELSNFEAAHAKDYNWLS